MSLHANQKGGEAHDTVNVLTGKRTEMGKNRTQSFYSSAILKFKDIIIIFFKNYTLNTEVRDRIEKAHSNSSSDTHHITGHVFRAITQPGCFSNSLSHYYNRDAVPV